MNLTINRMDTVPLDEWQKLVTQGKHQCRFAQLIPFTALDAITRKTLRSSQNALQQFPR